MGSGKSWGYDTEVPPAPFYKRNVHPDLLKLRLSGLQSNADLHCSPEVSSQPHSAWASCPTSHVARLKPQQQSSTSRASAVLVARTFVRPTTRENQISAAPRAVPQCPCCLHRLTSCRNRELGLLTVQNRALTQKAEVATSEGGNPGDDVSVSL